MDLQDRLLGDEPSLSPSAWAVLARQLPIQPHPNDLAEAVKLIATSRRVVVVNGLVATAPAAVAAARELAAQCDGILATTLPARGLYRDDPFDTGIAGDPPPRLRRRC